MTLSSPLSLQLLTIPFQLKIVSSFQYRNGQILSFLSLQAQRSAFWIGRGGGLKSARRRRQRLRRESPHPRKIWNLEARKCCFNNFTFYDPFEGTLDAPLRRLVCCFLTNTRRSWSRRCYGCSSSLRDKMSKLLTCCFVFDNKAHRSLIFANDITSHTLVLTR